VVRQFLPRSFNGATEGESMRHMHLLLAVSDNQLVFLINWLAVAFTLHYLPSPRVLIHFSCHGSLTKKFVEQYLLQECEPRPKRVASSNETSWRRIIKDRLGTFLEIIHGLDDSDAGAMTFDLDSIWIRNMVPVFDTFALNYDFIAQGTMMDNAWGGRVITNFGGVYFKNSPAARALAAAAITVLNSDYEPPMPDQDVVSRVLFDLARATQKPLPEFEKMTKTSAFATDRCSMYPDTCTHTAAGVNGTFSLDPAGNQSASNSPAVVSGSYLFLPQIVAPLDCSHVCSTSTLLFQHCGLSRCLPDGAEKESGELSCSAIPEFILAHSNALHALAKQPVMQRKFKRAPRGVFDSRTGTHMIEQVERFVDKSRAERLCKVYGKICKIDGHGFVVSET